MSKGTCSVDGCEKPTHRKSFCCAHYMRVWRHGSTERKQYPFADIRGRTYGLLTCERRLPNGQWVCLCECGQRTLAWAGDLNRGAATTCGARSHKVRDFVGYPMAHRRVVYARGMARLHACVDCGVAAAQWSYDHRDPDEIISDRPSTLGIAYSLKIEHYQARCVPCHKRFDLHRIDSANPESAYG